MRSEGPRECSDRAAIQPAYVTTWAYLMQDGGIPPIKGDTRRNGLAGNTPCNELRERIFQGLPWKY